MKKLVVLTGSGMSSESGLKTFRETGGLWEEYDVMEVASYSGWIKNQELVLQFYNERRSQLKNAEPNYGHKGLAELEQYFNIQVITQNVDDLHERAGSTKVLHLHGLLTRVRSIGDPSLIYDIGYEPVSPGDTCEKGYQLRPDIVWFGEPVPAMTEAAEIVASAEIFVVIGTSMVVYPAASLIDYVRQNTPVFIIDPHEVSVPVYRHIEFIKEKAGDGVGLLKKKLLQDYRS